MNQRQTDIFFMSEALQLARNAAGNQEVPVGAVVVLGDQIIGKGSNLTIEHCDPSAHAEIVAIRDAAKQINNHRIEGASLYVTLEPCIMCAGAILHARINRLIFAARDQRFGAAGSQLNLLESPFLNHQTPVTAGVCQHEASGLLQSFFQARR